VVLVVVLAGYVALNPYLFTDFYRDCVSIKAGMTADEVLRLMSDYTNPGFDFSTSTTRIGFASDAVSCWVETEGNRVIRVETVSIGF
jgi:hypothetical protein